MMATHNVFFFSSLPNSKRTLRVEPVKRKNDG
jgi:hypothetical protein